MVEILCFNTLPHVIVLVVTIKKEKALGACRCLNYHKILLTPLVTCGDGEMCFKVGIIFNYPARV